MAAIIWNMSREAWDFVYVERIGGLGSPIRECELSFL
jgi:hypothetical protein